MSSFPITSGLNALNPRRQVSKSEDRSNEALSEIASGLDTSESPSDSDSLSIADSNQTDIRSDTRTLQNFQLGISSLQSTREGIDRVSQGLRDLRQVAQSVSEGERSTSDSQDQVDTIVNQLEEITSDQRFSGDNLLSGDVQGSEESANTPGNAVNGDQPNTSVEDLSPESLSLDSVDVSSSESADRSLDTINAAINQVATLESELSSAQNELESALDLVQIERSNQEAAATPIRDAQLGQETLERIQETIANRSDASALTQANNIQRSSALQLLG